MPSFNLGSGDVMTTGVDSNGNSTVQVLHGGVTYNARTPINADMFAQAKEEVAHGKDAGHITTITYDSDTSKTITVIQCSTSL